MSLTHFTGFFGRDVASDRIIATGSPTYDTSRPVGSYASRSLSLTNGDVARIPWWDGDTQAAPATGLFLHFRFFLVENNADNDNVRVGVAMDGTDAISFSVENTTSLPTILIGGSVVATGSVGNEVVPTTWSGNRYVMEIAGYTSGSLISVYAGGDTTSTPVVSHAISVGEAATLVGIGIPNETRMEMVASTSVFMVTDLCVMDPNDATGHVDPVIFTDFTVKGGAVIADSTPSELDGTVDDINDYPFNFSTFLFGGAVDLESAYTRNKLFSLTENVYSVRVVAGTSSYGTPSRLAFEFDDGTALEKSVAAVAPGDVANVYFQTSPSTVAWSPLGIDTSAFSIFSRT